MRLYSPVDSTGNVNMIVSLGWDWNRGTPDPRPDPLTSAPSSHIRRVRLVQNESVGFSLFRSVHQRSGRDLIVFYLPGRSDYKHRAYTELAQK